MRTLDIRQQAESVIQIEADAVASLSDRIDDQFEEACRRILECEGRVVVIGMGKSGHIGGKMASTLASTGTPSFFVHPGEASHGDLGMITDHDLVIAISNSGETSEVLTILPIVKRIGKGLIAMTGKPDSTLGKQADVCLDISVSKEACPHNLAPTASTTATLVMGDALAVSVQHMRGFSPQDFAATHPGGALGKRLLLYASDLMHRNEEIPLVSEQAGFQELMQEMSQKKLGMTGIIDENRHLIGIYTDGDLRRSLSDMESIYDKTAAELMSPNPYTVRPDTLAAEIVRIMREHAVNGPHAINGIFVVDEENQVVGALNTHDLLRVGVIS